MKVLLADEEANSGFYAKYGHDGRKELRQRKSRAKPASNSIVPAAPRVAHIEPAQRSDGQTNGGYGDADTTGETAGPSGLASDEINNDQARVRFTLAGYNDRSGNGGSGSGDDGDRQRTADSGGSFDTTLSGDESEMDGLVKPPPIPDVLMTLRMVIKCADIGHSAKPFDQHVEWSRRVVTEFYRQGIEEHSRGLPVQSFMDEANMTAIAGSQCGFLQFVALPIFDAFSQYAPEAAVLVQRLGENKAEWSNLKEINSGEDVALAEGGERKLGMAPDGSLSTGGYVRPDGKGLEAAREPAQG